MLCLPCLFNDTLLILIQKLASLQGMIREAINLNNCCISVKFVFLITSLLKPKVYLYPIASRSNMHASLDGQQHVKGTKMVTMLTYFTWDLLAPHETLSLSEPDIFEV